MNRTIGLLVIDVVAKLKTFIKAYLGSGNMLVVYNRSAVVFNKMGNRISIPIIVVHYRTTQMRLELGDRNYPFSRFAYPDPKSTGTVFAANEEPLLIGFHKLK